MAGASTSEPKVFWRMVEQMAGTKLEPPAIQDADERLLKTDEEICRLRLSKTGQDRQIDIFDLAAVLKSMKEKAPGQSGITRRYLREMQLELALHLIYVYNVTVSIGHFPSLWKSARVLMIPQKESFSTINS